MSEWPIVCPMLCEFLHIELARIVWEYARELRLMMHDHCIFARVDASGVDISDQQCDSPGIWGSMDFAYNGMVCLIASFDDVNGSQRIWHEPVIWGCNYLRDCGGREAENKDRITLLHRAAFNEQTTLFSPKWRGKMQFYHPYLLVGKELAFNRILDILHHNWMDEMTRHW